MSASVEENRALIHRFFDVIESCNFKRVLEGSSPCWLQCLALENTE
jgi:hypothetical protein